MQFSISELASLEASSDILRALAHPLRISILNFIAQEQPVKVFDIHTGLRLEQSITSQHLRILRDTDLVYTSREGKNIFYHLRTERLARCAESINNFDIKTLSARKKR